MSESGKSIMNLAVPNYQVSLLNEMPFVMQADIASSHILTLMMKYQILPQLKREMFIDQVIASVSYTREEILIAREQFYQQHHLISFEQQQAWMERHSLSLQDVDKLAIRQFGIEKFKRNCWNHVLEGYFYKRKPQLDQVVYSVLRATDWQTAFELFLRLEAGEASFADLVYSYSQGQEAQTGGLVGPVELGTLPSALARTLISNQLGQLLRPFRLGEWIVIVRLETLIFASLDEAMRQRLLDELFENWIQEQMM